MRKRFSLALILLTFILTPILLAVSLRSPEFQPSRGEFPQFTFFDLPIEEPPEGEVGEGGVIDLFFNFEDGERGFLWIFIAVGIALLIAASFVQEGRQMMAAGSIQIITALIVIYFFRRSIISLLSSLGLLGFSGGVANSDTATRLSVPPLFSLLVTIVIAGVITFVGLRIYERFRPKETAASDSFIDDVQSTLDRLDAGGNLRETILDCYRAMLHRARSQRLIGVQSSATTIELEQRLVSVGLPAKETGRLSRLFEQVRYGGHDASERERREARDCLVAFITAADRKTNPHNPTI